MLPNGSGAVPTQPSFESEEARRRRAVGNVQYNDDADDRDFERMLREDNRQNKRQKTEQIPDDIQVTFLVS